MSQTYGSDELLSSLRSACRRGTRRIRGGPGPHSPARRPSGAGILPALHGSARASVARLFGRIDSGGDARGLVDAPVLPDGPGGGGRCPGHDRNGVRGRCQTRSDPIRRDFAGSRLRGRNGGHAPAVRPGVHGRTPRSVCWPRTPAACGPSSGRSSERLEIGRRAADRARQRLLGLGRWFDSQGRGPDQARTAPLAVGSRHDRLSRRGRALGGGADRSRRRGRGTSADQGGRRRGRGSRLDNGKDLDHARGSPPRTRAGRSLRWISIPPIPP